MKTFSGEWLAELAYKAIIIALLALWIAYPPQGAHPPGSRSVLGWAAPDH